MTMMSEKKARSVLGVSDAADLATIRNAWKRKVRKYHPDRSGGSTAKFVAIGNAYEVLDKALDTYSDDFVRPFNQQAEAKAKRASKRAAKPAPKKAPKKHDADRRGTLAPELHPRRRVVPVPPTKQSLCEGLLSRHALKTAFQKASRQNGGFYVDPRVIRRDDGKAANHIGQSISVEEGRVSILVTGKMRQGTNNVSVPVGTRIDDQPTLIRFDVAKTGFGRVRVPDSVRKLHFPWAKTLEITFTG